MKHRYGIWIAMVIAATAWNTFAGESPAHRLFVSCGERNDIWRLLVANHLPARRMADPQSAIDAASEGDGVLLLADGYPDHLTPVSDAVFDAAAKKRLRLYIEYPARLPDLQVAAPKRAHLERAVVCSDFFGPGLPRLDLLGINGMTFVPVQVRAADSAIVAAKVAGFDTAVYGLPASTSPILFKLPDRDVMVATTKLSQFITGRYGPSAAWGVIWNRLIGWAMDGPAVKLAWTPPVRATYGPHDPLPADVEAWALRRAVSWFTRSKLLLDSSREAQAKQAGAKGELLPPPVADAPVGDGSRGIMEAPLAIIHADGGQSISPALRGDCHAEAAMAMALGSKLTGDAHDVQIAQNLLDFYLLKSDARKKERGNPASPAYGLIAWGVSSTPWYIQNYGDDNARVILGTLATAAITGQNRWDEPMALCLLANLRTTGPDGLRPNSISLADLRAHGWKYYFKKGNAPLSPHFQSWLWACDAWAYAHNGDALFLERAEAGVRRIMSAGPKRWVWTNGLAQEKARMLLPLAWLVRAKDTPEHRRWLEQGVKWVLEMQRPCGAIREELGDLSHGEMRPPASNDAYGKGEAPLIQHNGDPVADMLYTSNFAFIGLHEAVAATGNPEWKKAEDKLAEFLCRAQVRSESHPELDGGWFRGFDFDRWEAWGSNADAGWGVWAIESGWTQGWITATLALRQMHRSLWELTSHSGVGDQIRKRRPQMIPE